MITYQHVLKGEPVTLTYTNWKGKTGERTIEPKDLWFGITEWHTEPQWFIRALDCQKGELRDFALKEFGASPDLTRGALITKEGEG